MPNQKPGGPAKPAFYVEPRSDEVALIHSPTGKPARIYTAQGDSVIPQHGAGKAALIAVVPGNVEHIGWGANVSYFGNLRGVRNGHHKLDRPTWEMAAKLVATGGVVYIRYEQQDYFGNPRWTAHDIRMHIECPAYRVTFDRIGRNRAPADLVTKALHADPDVRWVDLGKQILKHAGKFLGSRGAEVDLDTDKMTGTLFVGGIRPAGQFQLTAIDPDGEAWAALQEAQADKK